MKQTLAIFLCVVTGCAGAPAPVPHTIPEARWVENEPLPPDARTEALPPGTPDDDERRVESYEPGATTNPTQPGIVISESRMARDLLYRIRYPELRLRYEADRNVWVVQRQAYEARLQLAAERILELRPTWWERNRGHVLGMVGFVFGVASTIAIARVVE